MKVAVTGGAGAIGGHAVAELAAAGYDVLSLDLRHDEGPTTGSVREEICDVGDAVRFSQLLRKYEIEVVAHLAAALPVAANRDLDTALDINVRGAHSVVEACGSAKIEALVHLSSKAVYGRPGPPHAHPTYTPVPECAAKRPVDYYGITKLAGENVVRCDATARGLPTALLRLGSTFGAGKGARHGAISWISDLVQAAVTGEKILLRSDPEAATDLIYNRDVGRAVVAAVAMLTENPPRDPTAFNIASGYRTDVEQVCRAINDLAGREVVVLETRGAGRGVREVSVPATGVVLDTERARDRMGFLPQLSIQQALDEFIAESGG